MHVFAILNTETLESLSLINPSARLKKWLKIWLKDSRFRARKNGPGALCGPLNARTTRAIFDPHGPKQVFHGSEGQGAKWNVGDKPRSRGKLCSNSEAPS